MMIELSGAELTEANSTAQALEIISQIRFDALVSDIGIPEEDCFSLIEKIRKFPAEVGGSTPAVALTAYARSEDRIRALQAGFQRHSAKPIEHAELIAVVATLARRSPHQSGVR